MIDRYFVCCDCKIYIDAGGRWAYWTLEDAGIVVKGAPISLSAILSTQDYWNPERDEDSTWLYVEVFPSVRNFLKEHEGHRVIFGDKDDFLSGDEEDYLEDCFGWMAVGFCAMPSPRSFVEQLGLKTWDEVCDYYAKQGYEPGWMHPKLRDAARKKFEEMVKPKSAS